MDLSNYTAAQQTAINLLIAKLYGAVPPESVTRHFTGAPVTSAEFNARITQLHGILAYLEDARRDEVARAQVAEGTLENRIDALSDLMTGGQTLITDEFTGTLAGTDLTVTAGTALIGGVPQIYTTIANPVEFTALVVQRLVLHQNGVATVEDASYANTLTSLVIGTWDGNNYFPGSANNVFVQNAIFERDVTLGGDDQSVVFVRGAEINISERDIERVYDAYGRIMSEVEKDGATVVKSTTFSYDAFDNISNVTITAGGRTVVKAVTYDPNGNPILEDPSVI